MGRRSKKAGALVLAAAIGTLAPGVSPLTAGTPVASAQEAAEERAAWMPPEPSAAYAPRPTGRAPEGEFKKESQCVSSAAGDPRNVGDAKILQDRPWGQMHLRLDKVHSYVRAKSKQGNVGGGIKVAVIDTGVTPHPFFQDRLSSGADYVDNAVKKPGLEDCDGHGTQVAGIIAGNPQDSTVGFIGVAPDAKIVSFRQTSQAYKVKTEEEKAREVEAEKAKEKAAAQQRAAEAQIRKAKDDAAQARKDAAEAAKRANENKDDGGGGTTNGETTPGQAGGEPRTIGSGASAGDLHTLAMAVKQAADTPGVKVINMSIDSCRESLGDFTQMSSMEKELQGAVRYAVEKKDVVVVAAAGNKGGRCVQNGEPGEGNPAGFSDPNKPNTIVTPPWFAEDLLAVGAIDKTGGVAEFSMHGPWVSVAAPGTEAISLDPAPGSRILANQMIEGGKATDLQGTSFAAPYVAGVAALVRQLYPELSARQVMERIKRTAQHPGAAGARDQFIGHGVIDPMAALTATLPEDIGLAKASSLPVKPDMPPTDDPQRVPMIVALAGSGGAAAALGIVLVAVQATRRTRERRAKLEARS